MDNFDNLDNLLAEVKALTAGPSSENTDSDRPLPRAISPKPAAKEHRERKERSDEKNLLSYVHDFVFLLAILLVFSLLFLRIVVVSGTSMNTTLLDGDYLLVLSNTFYKEPRAGDVIVASMDSFDDGAPIVKRVIATEGQWVDIDFDTGTVWVGDSPDSMVALHEPYISSMTYNSEGVQFPLQVYEGCIFVLGDNRGVSLDSRSPRIGQIDKREVLGKVVFLFLPGTNEGEYSMDFGRIGVVR